MRLVAERIPLLPEDALDLFAEIASALTLGLAMILTLPARTVSADEHQDGSRECVANFSASSSRLTRSRSSVTLEIHTGLDDQSVGVGLEALRVDLA